jgi:arginyl-tRNA synthetase
MDVIQSVIQNTCRELFRVEVDVELTRPDEQFGDFATNIALKLASQLNVPPRELAERIAEHVQGQNTHIKSVTVAGPGFINIAVADDLLWSLAHSKPAKTLAGKVVVAEYSDPNPFKVLHAGHLYTTIVGDAIAKLLESAGAAMHRLNYGGDVGLHVGKTMWAIKKYIGGEENVQKLSDIGENDRLDWLSARYIEGNEAYETDENAKLEITAVNKQVYEVHAQNDHESNFANIYWTCRQWSYDGFDTLYKQLQIDAFERYVPESEVTPKGLEIVKKGLEEGVFQESDGAIVFMGEQHGLHTRVFINSGGLPTYEAKDLGLAAHKWETYHFDLSLIVTANDIVEYMKVVIKALSHFYPDVVSRTKHFTHGVIKLPGGVKMSSRKGNILRAIDILEAATSASSKATGKEDQNVVLAAVKYAFLKQRIGGDIIYDPDESVSLLGNSGPYLQYAHARARSILHKSSNSEHSFSGEDLQTDERSLVRKLGEYAEVVDQAVQELMPHHICTYLYELAQTFNSFYERNRVIGDPREPLRLKLIQVYADTLKSGLQLLNIPTPDRM